MEHRRQVSSRAIVGRDGPLRSLDRALDDAAAGAPQLALIAGEPGVGKTRLVGALEARGRDAGFLVLHGESLEFGGEEFPYAPVVAALRELPLEDELGELDEDARGALAALLPRLRLDDGGPRFSNRFGQGRLYELMLELLRRAAERRPLLVVLEDVHWADRSTRDFVAFLARNLRAERIALALTYRTGELRADAPDAAPRRGVGAPAARHAARPRAARPRRRRRASSRRSPARPCRRALAGELHARAGGNPFFVEELFAARRDGRPAVPGDDRRRRAGCASRRSPGAARELLAVVAAAGGQAAHAVLERCTPEPGSGRRCARRSTPGCSCATAPTRASRCDTG